MAQFQPGQSGNPGGRPKGEARIRAAAQEHSEAALSVLVTALEDPDARIRIKAAEVLLDRGFGKPAQSLSIGNEDGQAFKLDTVHRVIVDPRDSNSKSLQAAAGAGPV